MKMSEGTRRAVELYADGAVQRYTAGSMSHADWETARSYAVDAVSGLLRDNPDIFDYTARIEAARKQKDSK